MATAAPRRKRRKSERVSTAGPEPQAVERVPVREAGLLPESPEGFQPEPRPTRQQVRERAYLYYLARAGAPGDAFSDWVRAERDLRAEMRRGGEADG